MTPQGGMPRKSLSPAVLAWLLAGGGAAAALLFYILRGDEAKVGVKAGLLFEQPRAERSVAAGEFPVPAATSSLDMLSKPQGWQATDGGVSAPPQELIYDEIIYAERLDSEDPGRQAGQKGKPPFERPAMKTGKTFRGQASSAQTAAALNAQQREAPPPHALGKSGSAAAPQGPAKEAAASRLMAPVIPSAGPALAAPGANFTPQQQALYEQAARAAESGGLSPAQLQIAAEKAVAISAGSGPTVGAGDAKPSVTPKHIFQKNLGGAAGTLGGE